MELSRRALLGSLSAASVLPLAAQAAPQLSLPDKSSYDFHGIFLNAAYAHPLNRLVRQAGNDFLMARADKDMYAAKDCGRNRVLPAEPYSRDPQPAILIRIA